MGRPSSSRWGGGSFAGCSRHLFGVIRFGDPGRLLGSWPGVWGANDLASKYLQRLI